MTKTPTLVTNSDDHEPNQPPVVPPEPKIIRMYGAHMSPALCMQLVMQHIDRIKSVVLVVNWDDDTHQVTWSRQTSGNLATASVLLAHRTAQVVMGEDDSTTYTPLDPDHDPEPEPAA